MIKFFRRIRQNLLTENKIGKYLLYAGGEIMLVMIGILLALQLNNWNQDRIDRISERKLLANIHRDFIANKQQFDTVKLYNYQNIAALENIISLFPVQGDTAKIRVLFEHHSNIKGITYNPYSSTVNAIINSNSLELIQNEKLQEYLVSWKDVLEDYQEEEVGYFKMLNDHYWPYFTDAFDYTGRDIELTTASASTIKFQNMVISRKDYINGIIESIENDLIEHHINEIIRLTARKVEG